MDSIQSVEAVLAEFFQCTDDTRRKQLESGLVESMRAPNAYIRCCQFLSQSRDQRVVYYCLLVFEEVILRQWQTLNADSRLTVRRFVHEYLRQNYTTLAISQRNKIVKVFVDLAKQEWPETYPEFLNDIVAMPTKQQQFHILSTLLEECYSTREDISIYRRRDLQRTLGACIETVLSPVLTFLDSICRNQDLPQFTSQAEVGFTTAKSVQCISDSYEHNTPVVDSPGLSNACVAAISGLVMHADRSQIGDTVESLENAINCLAQMITSLAPMATKDSTLAEAIVDAVYSAVGTLLSRKHCYDVKNDPETERVWCAVANLLNCVIAESCYLPQVYYGRSGEKGQQIVMSIMYYMLQLLEVPSSLAVFQQALDLWIAWLSQTELNIEAKGRLSVANARQPYPTPAMRNEVCVALCQTILAQMQWASLSLRLDESERVGTDLKIEQHDELQAIVSAACDVLSRLWQQVPLDIVPQAGRYFVEGSAKAFTNAINANALSQAQLVEVSMNCTFGMMIIGTLHECVRDLFIEHRETTEQLVVAVMGVSDLCLSKELACADNVLASVHATSFRTLALFSEWIITYGNKATSSNEAAISAASVEGLLMQITRLLVHTLARQGMPTAVYSGAIEMLRRMTARIRPLHLLTWGDMSALVQNLHVIEEYLPKQDRHQGQGSANRENLTSALYIAVTYAYLQPYANLPESGQNYTERAAKYRTAMGPWLDRYNQLHTYVNTHSDASAEETMRLQLTTAADIIYGIKDLPKKSKEMFHAGFEPVLLTALEQCAKDTNYLTASINVIIAVTDCLGSQAGKAYTTGALDSVMSAAQHGGQAFGPLLITKLLQLILRKVQKRTTKMMALYTNTYAMLLGRLLPRLRGSGGGSTVQYDTLQMWFKVIYEMCDCRWDYFFNRNATQVNNGDTFFAIMEVYHWALGEQDITLYYEVLTSLWKLDERNHLFKGQEFMLKCRESFASRLMNVLVEKRHYSHAELTCQVAHNLAKADGSHFYTQWLPQYIQSKNLQPQQTELLRRKIDCEKDLGQFAFTRLMLDTSEMIRHYTFMNSRVTTL